MLQHVLSLACSGVIISVLRQMHWLPVRQRIHFKIAGCVFQALTGQALADLVDDCRLISDSDRRRLRSSDIRTCVTPPPRERLRDSVAEVFQLLVLKFGTVYRLHSGLRTWRLTVSNEDDLSLSVYIGLMRSQRLVTIDSWRYIYSLCMYVCMYWHFSEIQDGGSRHLGFSGLDISDVQIVHKFARWVILHRQISLKWYNKGIHLQWQTDRKL